MLADKQGGLPTILAGLVVALAFLAGCVERPMSARMNGTEDNQAVGFATSPPAWNKGEKWVYSDGYAMRVEKVAANTVAGRPPITRFSISLNGGEGLDRSAATRWVEREGLFKVASLTGSQERHVVFRHPDPQLLFPLEVGKSLVFNREYYSGEKNGPQKLHHHRTRWQVLGVKQSVVVPAGTFDCWVLSWRSDSLVSSWSGQETWWYSPEVGHYVRLEYQYGDAEPSSRVLLSYTPAPGTEVDNADRDQGSGGDPEVATPSLP